MTDLHINGGPVPGLARASLAQIETEVADVLDAMEGVQEAADSSDPLWQVAEAVRGLAWAVGSLALHYQDTAVGQTAETAAATSLLLERIARRPR